MSIYIDLKNMIKDENYINIVQDVANSLRKGELAIFPTDTVYGIGTNGLDELAVKSLFLAKNRPLSNPINLLVDSIDMIKTITTNITDLEYELMETFFPGAFSIILPKNNLIPNIVTANSDFVGIRIPNNRIVLDLIKYSGIPLATTSANISGKLSATTASDIPDDLNTCVKYILDDDITTIGLESTVVQVINNNIHVLRLGSILPTDLEKISKNILINTNNIPSANLKHYNSDSNKVLVYSNNELNMLDKICSLAKSYSNPIIICCSENLNTYSSTLKDIPNLKILDYGSKFNLQSISHKLFHLMYEIEKIPNDIIIIEGIKKENLGITIMDKLIKIVNGNYIDL